MLVSVFTPSHDPAGLPDLWRCLCAQAHESWEWVVVPNGPRADEIVSFVRGLTQAHDRVRVVPAPPSVTGIGALKRFACGQCAGGLFVEVDHDDLITPDCLETLVAAVGDRTNALVYSDCLTTRDGADEVYDPGYGWRNYRWNWNGTDRTVNATHPVTARSLCDVLYAPDHIRAWTAEAYKRSGGHDPKLAVGDDHELLCRTYLAGAEFVHVPRPLYVHQLTNKTTSQTRLADVHRTVANTRDRYAHDLVREWCRREKLPMLDLGGAHNCPPGFTPVDPHATNTPFACDVFELETLIADNSVGCFRAFDFLEHVPPAKVVPLMNLLWKKLVPGGWILSHTPAVCDEQGRCGRGATQDPTHLSMWSSNSFWYYTDRNYAKYVPDIACRFQSVRVGTWYPSDFHRTHLIPYTIFDGVALKDDTAHYHPGPRSI